VLSSTNGTTISGVASGQRGANFIEIEVLDKYDNVVYTDSESQATLVATGSASPGGTIVISAVHGLYNFSDFSITGWPGNTTEFFIQSTAIDSSNSDLSNHIEI
jgi:hypothetical protein